MSNATDADNEYLHIRVWAAGVSLFILAFFNLIINWTIVREERLRSHARFVLVFHLLFSALVYFAVCFSFYLQNYLNAATTETICKVLIRGLMTSGSNIILTITAMALDRYFAICYPLYYSKVCFKPWPWLIGILTWGLASIIPLTLPPQTNNTSTAACGREALRGGEIQKIILITVCTILIVSSYVRILYEGRRLGVLNRRNRAACRTIALHGTQLAVFILPNFILFLLYILNKQGSIDKSTKELFAVISFAFFSLAQCIAPIVYGLRKEELLEHLNHRFPCLSGRLKRILEWTVNIAHPQRHRQQRERRMTSETLLSREISQTTV
ncbi:odorant receptor 131-2 [Megalobrama amblycephala]|uniref:odorant receptor 131-2 n=1 Tax=Megalobrama amblycephala TaxID=75352 RepID=UPI0020146895|nr:odorant receptor 131-2 [Megalobrama amblycephala]